MTRILLISFFAFFFCSVNADAQHPISSAHIIGMDGKTELLFDDPITDSFSINVLDLTGKSMFTQYHQASEDGCTSVEIPVENLRKGIYMVQVMNTDGKTKTLKLQRN